MDPRDRLRSMGKQMTDPVEPLAQRVAERAIDGRTGRLSSDVPAA